MGPAAPLAPPIRVLLFSTLYPSASRPGHGIFVETRLRQLMGSGGIDARVVAPVPWFPSAHPRFGAYARFAATPRQETHNGLDLLHPRYLLLPKVGMSTAPLALALGAVPALRRLRAQGFDFDLIDAHYYYPDGVAAALLGRWFKRPVAITARGSDVNLIAGYALPRRMMAWAARSAAASIGVSQALATRLMEIGAPPSRVQVMRNGVDTERFSPVPRLQARQQLGLDGSPLLLSVGNLDEVKRHHLVIEALALLRQRHPGARLAVVGGGTLRDALQARAQALGVADAVRFAGSVPQSELRAWYSAADLMVLASSREGWPNVLLECMACGTPVVASRVGGVPEVVSSPEVGTTVNIDGAASLATAVEETLARGLDAGRIRDHAAAHDWAHTSQAQKALFTRLAGKRSAVA